MLSQIDIRYSVSKTIAEVKSLVNAFPGNISLCLENNVLYQYVEYATAADVPTANDSTILQTTNPDLLSRWIAIDSFSAKSIYGDIKNSNWVLDATNKVYKYTITLPNTVNSFFVKFIDRNNKEVYVEDVVQPGDIGAIKTIDCIVGAIPDCRFEGKFLVYFDKLM